MEKEIKINLGIVRRMKITPRFLALSLLIWLAIPSKAQLPPSFKSGEICAVRSSEVIRKYLTPVRIVKLQDPTGKQLLHAAPTPRTGR